MNILGKIRKGRIQGAHKILLYGVEGVGKSTFAASWPRPIYLCSESGTEQLDVARLPEPSTWADALASVDALTYESHNYATLVVDTVDWLEPLLYEHLCRENKWRSIEDAGFGRGYVAALGEWRILLRKLETLRAKGIHVLLLGHSTIRRISPPDSEPFDRYTLKIHEKSAALLREWADCVLFAQYDQIVGKPKTGVARALPTGERIMRTTYGGGWDAKNRLGLPESIPMDASLFVGGEEVSLPDLLQRIGDDEFTDKVLTWVDQQEDKADAIAKAIKRAKERLNGN